MVSLAHVWMKQKDKPVLMVQAADPDFKVFSIR